MNNILKEIKLEVQRKINIQKNKEVSTDQEVLKIINNLKDYNNSTKCYLIKMYAAIYFDNLSLLEYLEKNNFSLGTYPNNIAIYLLDNSLTKYFTKESYLDYLIQYKPYFQGFFLSLKNIDYSLKDYYIKRFIYLSITIKKKLISIKDNNGLIVSNIFNKISLDTFSDEAYQKATPLQLGHIFNFLINTPDEKTKTRLNNLIITSNFNTHFHDYNLMFSLFDDEELKEISPSVEYYFLKAKDNNIPIKRALNIYHSNHNIIYNTGCLKESIFNNYKDEEIILLSKEINFSRDYKSLKVYNLKRRVLTLLPWTK